MKSASGSKSTAICQQTVTCRLNSNSNFHIASVPNARVLRASDDVVMSAALGGWIEGKA